jgi:Holliday junction DNA helicase RuvB
MSQRVVNAQLTDDDAAWADAAPADLDEYIGQARMKDSYGLHRSGETTAGRSTMRFSVVRQSSGRRPLPTSLRVKWGDVVLDVRTGPCARGRSCSDLTNLQEHDVLFIDEIHRLPASVEEALYPAMEDFQLDLVVGQGPAGQSKLDLPVSRW